MLLDQSSSKPLESAQVSKSSEIETPSSPPTPTTEISDSPADVAPIEITEEPIVAVEDGDGDFIDDDFGLSIKREWEHLRQQQQRIEEEINNIQKETVPVSKPPPPYTPPASPPTSDLPRSPRRPPPMKPDVPCYVPSTKEELTKVVKTICKRILSHRQNLSLSEIEFQDLVKNGGQQQSSYSTFLRFVIDLVEQLMSDMLSTSKQHPNPPWMQQKTLVGRKIHCDDISDEDIIKRINRHVLVAFNYEKWAQKENLIVRWSHKRRDRVDQVLVRELHAEEASWTNYQDDEVQVKDEISNMIMDALVNDTVQVLKRVMLSRQG